MLVFIAAFAPYRLQNIYGGRRISLLPLNLFYLLEVRIFNAGFVWFLFELYLPLVCVMGFSVFLLRLNGSDYLYR